MKVKNVIERLNKIYNLDDELMIDWVDKEYIEDMFDMSISDTDWELIIEDVDNNSIAWEVMSNAVVESAYRVVKKEEEDGNK